MQLNSLVPFLLCCFLFMATNASAQVQIGLLAGYNNSHVNYKGEKYDGVSDNVTGKELFLQLKSNHQRRAVFVLELGYEERGMPYMPESFCPNFKELQLNYLSVGTQIEYRVVNLGKLRLSAMAGMNTSYLNSAYVMVAKEDNPWGTIPKHEVTLDQEFKFQRTAFGVKTGPVASLHLGRLVLLARGTYYFGLTEIASQSYLTSRSAAFSLGLAFAI